MALLKPSAMETLLFSPHARPGPVVKEAMRAKRRYYKKIVSCPVSGFLLTPLVDSFLEGWRQYPHRLFAEPLQDAVPFVSLLSRSQHTGGHPSSVSAVTMPACFVVSHEACRPQSACVKPTTTL